MKWTIKNTYAGKRTNYGDYYNEPDYETVEIEHDVWVTVENGGELWISATDIPDSFTDEVSVKFQKIVALNLGCHWLDVMFIETNNGLCGYEYRSDIAPNKGIHWGAELVQKKVNDILSEFEFEVKE